MNELHPNNILIYHPTTWEEVSAWNTRLSKEELMKRMWGQEWV
jgi:hypothetical protein